MTSSRSARDAKFSVRCKCGEVYNTDDAHAGRTLRCRCGRTVTLVRPNEEYVRIAGATTENQARRRKSRTMRSGDYDRIVVPGQTAHARGWRRVWAPIADAMDFAMHDTRSYRVVRRWTARMSWIWCLATLLSWILLITASESFRPATLLAYGPRFVLLLPLVVLVPLAIATTMRTLLPLLFGLIITLGPIMGGRVSWHTVARAMPVHAPAQTIRVVTYNVDGGAVLAARLPEMIERLQPDIVAFQECGDALWQALQALPRWNQRRYLNLCTASKWPMPVEESMPRSVFARGEEFGAESESFVVRYIIATPYGQLGLVNLHLETARHGLDGLDRSEELSANGDVAAATSRREIRRLAEDRLGPNIDMRERESERAAAWAVHGDTRLPVVLSGDFNLPVESTIYRKHWSAFTDAFEATGTGFGFTKNVGTLIHLRIDRVAGNEQAPLPVGAWLGPDYGSDHLPVVADLTWRSR